MRSADPYAFASLAAEQIVKGVGLASLPIDPIAFARSKDIEVVPKPTSSAGVSGMLIRHGNYFAIGYATHFGNEGFENFSVGHELGHLHLPGHSDAVIGGENGVHESRSGFTSSDRYELEADRFAAGFLMPRHLFFPAIQKAGEGLAAIEGLALLCKTSLHATAIRYTQCTRDAMAIVVSRGSVIDHCFMSTALKEVSGIDWLKKRESLPSGTPTRAFNQDQENVRLGRRIEDASQLQDWFGGNRRILVREDVVGLGKYGRTLTVIHEIDVPDDEDEEDERALQDSWKAGF